MAYIKIFFMFVAVAALFSKTEGGENKFYMLFNQLMVADVLETVLDIRIESAQPCFAKNSRFVVACRTSSSNNVEEVISVEIFEEDCAYVAYGLCVEVAFESIIDFEESLTSNNYELGEIEITTMNDVFTKKVNVFTPNTVPCHNDAAFPTVYLRSLICAALTSGLPDDAINYLMNMNHRNDDSLPLDHCP